ncbi:hypothetical protein BC830DRAFT_1118804 [Chytriomyces sp. MP71]|nr:hypothetical protein BC830DRAFT_1118804 [Chytriomyces sp. MP71]
MLGMAFFFSTEIKGFLCTSLMVLAAFKPAKISVEHSRWTRPESQHPLSPFCVSYFSQHYHTPNSMLFQAVLTVAVFASGVISWSDPLGKEIGYLFPSQQKDGKTYAIHFLSSNTASGCVAGATVSLTTSSSPVVRRALYPSRQALLLSKLV